VHVGLLHAFDPKKFREQLVRSDSRKASECLCKHGNRCASMLSADSGSFRAEQVNMDWRIIA
jgi:hypothetical protein